MTSPEDPLPPQLSPRAQAARLGGVPKEQADPAAGGAYRAGRSGRKAERGPKRRRSRWKSLLLLLGVLVVLLLLVVAGTWIWADGRLTKVAAITEYSGRPADGPGTNWLIVGSDSRAGLTGQQQQELHVGSDTGGNTDTIMVLHKGSNGPVLMSIPRDSYVIIPAYTSTSGTAHASHKDKINAAFAAGGPQLLVKTVETTTGIHLDHYTEVGFTGVVDIVNALGGVPICLSAPVVDAKSGANLKAGCQTLKGTQSLQLVRTRYSLPDSDLSRIQNQQQFLQAMAKRVVSPGTWLNPFTLYPFLSAALDSLTVDRGTGMWTLSQFGLQMHRVSGSGGKTVTVPLSTQNYTTPSGASAVLWSPSGSATLFDEIQNDRPVTAKANPSGTTGS
ncbi:LytR family transcriptional attenuator [Streptomyces sp. 846.5]|nr:LCP family protein [Streptomyces sp. 846.5]TDU06296.1 LytR family transcriptional attenuator [Streptomyces sp. 846.5]